MSPAEARYALVAREMLESSDWIQPRLNHVRFYAKPPLTFWCVATSYRIFGFTEFASRLPSALAYIGTVVVTFLLALELAGSGTAPLAGLIYATSLGPRPVPIHGYAAGFLLEHRALGIGEGRSAPGVPKRSHPVLSGRFARGTHQRPDWARFSVRRGCPIRSPRGGTTLPAADSLLARRWYRGGRSSFPGTYSSHGAIRSSSPSTWATSILLDSSVFDIRSTSPLSRCPPSGCRLCSGCSRGFSFFRLRFRDAVNGGADDLPRLGSGRP